MSGAEPTAVRLPRSDAAVLETADLTVRYHGNPSLHGVTVGVERGKVVAVVGPSGCGKTTFLNTLNRMTDLVPAATVDGSVRLDGEEIARVDPVALRRRVGMIFQTPNPFPMSIRKNVELALREQGVRSRAARDAIVRASLRDVGLYEEVHHRLDTSAESLSGGQQQRLCIARALALRPEVLLMDEPCSALDPLATETVERLIATLRGRYTLVVATHNLAQARRIADHTLVFWLQDGGGRLIEAGETESIFERPEDPLTAAYVRGQKG